MKCLRWASLFIIVALVALLVPFSVSAASPSIDDVKAFQDYAETGDWLIVFTYNISGTANNSYCSGAYPWIYQFIDGATILGNWSVQQCGMRPAAIYWNAASASALEWGKAYTVKIYGNWGAFPNATRTINATDWIGANPTVLENWAIDQGTIMENYDKLSDSTVDYITIVPPPYNDVLTMQGGSLFDRGIPYLSTYIPDKFQITMYNYPLGYLPSTGGTTYATDLYDNWDVAVGPEVSAVLTTAAPYFGFVGADGGRMVGALLTLLGFLSLAIIEKSVAFLVILGGVMIGVFPMATVVMLVFVMAVVLIRSLFWSST